MFYIVFFFSIILGITYCVSLNIYTILYLMKCYKVKVFTLSILLCPNLAPTVIEKIIILPVGRFPRAHEFCKGCPRPRTFPSRDQAEPCPESVPESVPEDVIFIFLFEG